MKKLTLLAGTLIFSLTSLNGCAVTPPPVQTSMQPEKLAVQPIHNPPQVIYRIDKSRYLTLEDYSKCDDGSIYYHNDNKKIKTKLWFLSRGTMNYKGRFIWAAKNEDILALPFVRGDNDACGDPLRGCAYSILSASIDGGKKFSDIKFGAINSSSSKNYTIVVTDDAIYFKSNLYPSTDKYAINSNGEFYNVRQAWIQDEFYKGMLKLGVPEDVLVKENPMGYYDRRLTNKYHYTEAQVDELGVKSLALFHTLNNSPFTEKLPDIQTSNLGSSKFSCNTTSLSSQQKNQG
ncbi:hypothetical protein C2125_18185 [Rahnella aquatilis]|nr:hypothetical protein [Rahnella aquatilis]RBQ32861.1 hypothetical protein C2125_18185 [Rahnella aquatilis]